MYTLFVGNIAGVSDAWLHYLFELIGNFITFKKPTPAFGFAEFTDGHAAQRCIEALNGQTLPGSQGDKTIILKADERTLGLFRSLTENTGETSVDNVKNALNRMRSGEDAPGTVSHDAKWTSTKNDATPILPGHLQDLVVDDLPAESRGKVTSEIDRFRNAVVEKQRKRLQEKMLADKSRINTLQKKTEPSPQPASSQPEDPLDLDTTTEEAQLLRIERDEQRHQDALAESRKRKHAAFVQHEKKWLERQAAIFAHVDKRLHADSAAESSSQSLFYKLDNYDDVQMAARRKAPFYTDRVQWRAQTSSFRKRERSNDARILHNPAQDQALDFLHSVLGPEKVHIPVPSRDSENTDKGAHNVVEETEKTDMATGPRDKPLTESALTESVLQDSVKPVVLAELKRLGFDDDEPADAFLDHLREHHKQEEIIQDFEPLLEDDAASFVQRVWAAIALYD